MKKIVLLIITLLILFGCGFRSKELNEETKQKIQQEISKIKALCQEWEWKKFDDLKRF